MQTPDIAAVSVLKRAAAESPMTGHGWYFTVWTQVASRHGTDTQYPAAPEYGFHAFAMAEQELIDSAHGEALEMNE